MVVLKKFIQSLIVFVFGSIITEGLLRGLENKAHGKTFFGNKKTPKRTFTDVDDIVHISSEDGNVA